MRVQKIIQRRVRRQGNGINIVADVNAAFTSNADESGASHVEVSSNTPIVQRSVRKRAKEVDR